MNETTELVCPTCLLHKYSHDELLEWDLKLPYLNWDKHWQVRARPNFSGGAVVRYMVKNGEKEVSIYFDAKNYLGYLDEPYWEAYYLNGDDSQPERFLFGQEEEMIEFIRNHLN